MMESFLLIRVNGNLFSFNGFCTEPKSKLAKIEIKHAQSVPIQ